MKSGFIAAIMTLFFVCGLAVFVESADPYIEGNPNPDLILQGGENIASATVIHAIPYSNSGTTAGYSNDYDEVCPYTGGTAPDVVYSYTPAANEFLDISLCNSFYDTKLYVYQDAAETLVDCNDDICGSDNLKSELLGVPVLAGHTYYIIVDGYGANSGTYYLNVSYSEEPPTGSIAGIVTNETSHPIMGALIHAIGPSTADDITDFYGNYSLENLLPGIYNVMFSHPEYIDTMVTAVSVESGLITPLRLTLKSQSSPREPGWLNSNPRVLRDTINANAMAWTGVQLIDYDHVYSVTIDSIKSSANWIIVDNLSGLTIPSLGRYYLPVTFDMTGHSNENLEGEITIWHSGYDHWNIIPCEIRVTDQPAAGAIISTENSDFSLTIEPNVTGELLIRLYNSGDLPLSVYGTNNVAAWLTPVTNSGIATPHQPLDLKFAINTTGYQNIILADIVNIMSDAVNEPMLSVNIMITVAPDFVAGMNSLGDVNYDGYCNEGDVEYLVDYLFQGGPSPCLPAGDINGSGGLPDINDVFYLIQYLRFSGPPPINSCGQADNFRQHTADIQAQLKQYVSGHRGDWLNIPVYVQNHNHYKTQLALDITNGIIDDISVENVLGLGIETYVKVDTNLALDLNSIVIADSVGPEIPVLFDSLTHLYDLRIHLAENAPIGVHPINPSTTNIGRGPTLFLQQDNYASWAPMFAGTRLTVRPRITINEIIGVPNIGLVTELRNFPLSLSITSDADVANSMNIFIVNFTTGNTVYSDTVDQSLLSGTHIYNFTANWDIDTPGYYLIGAEVVTDLDESDGNNIFQITYLTDNIQVGLPPAEGFGGPRINIIDFHNYPPALADLPGNFASKNEDSESPEWDTYTGMSKDIDNNKCAHLPGYNSLGPHDDWLIFGPMTGVSLANPVLRFWETAFNWNDTSGSTHEFYIQYSADFDISTALAEGPILTHTPADHGIAPLIWLSVTVEFPDSIGVNDKVYFAWRYDGPEDRAKSKFDIWRVDYIEWFDSVVSGYEYIPGDVNMSAGTWPPTATGADVTYLVNFFRGLPTSQACLLDGFWCSADINGDCNIIGADVTKLVNVFRGQGSVIYCADYEPAWLTPADLPEDEPADWPNCETTLILNKEQVDQVIIENKIKTEDR